MQQIRSTRFSWEYALLQNQDKKISISKTFFQYWHTQFDTSHNLDRVYFFKDTFGIIITVSVSIGIELSCLFSSDMSDVNRELNLFCPTKPLSSVMYDINGNKDDRLVDDYVYSYYRF